ncbi:ElaB/YqjD/DUF883 family membrane-anchored ribosome-binding protein [Neorhizobium huautlense]|uniref:ElaB/YqjD/DUF883 family membrane-anchored ribosome-binding protein n=1 Tax=Neorhizobium huautlense TaxID=67774 RepID=A0ABT9Q198_9HYPH|nr:nutrient deprivation-induced protein [Neorhizobium huautlense]MDP9840496.1 ElaB/YqjD/DUF883 family membrane-anchored ribosome-binding protein [Neorhizobium huautlense]
MNEHEQPAQPSAAELKTKVAEDVQSVTDFARNEATAATDKAKDAATDQKNVIAHKLGDVAMAMEKVAAELEGGENRDIGRLTRNLGNNLRSASDSIQDRSLGEIAGMAEDFGRKQPLAFLSIAAIAGLAASRFITSSAPKSDRSASSPKNPAESRPVSGLPSTLVASTNVVTTEGRFND